MAAEQHHFEVSGTTIRLTPLHLDGHPDHRQALAAHGVRTTARVGDRVEVGNYPTPEYPVPQFHCELYFSIPLPEDPGEIPNGEPSRFLASTIRHMGGDGGLAVELWQPISTGIDCQQTPSWLYGLLPRLSFGWYGRDASYQRDWVRFGGGLWPGDQWSRGMHRVYATGGGAPELIQPMPPQLPVLLLVTEVPPPKGVDWPASLTLPATEPLLSGSPSATLEPKD
ncbi:hypothetical protein [Streptacidiphilus sp. EB103A]|uniref:hypothetical protein n=1 Tax=Streptacidiphilus sp. EB103A TaxID=3156275 RepID=UPI0035155020